MCWTQAHKARLSRGVVIRQYICTYIKTVFCSHFDDVHFLPYHKIKIKIKLIHKAYELIDRKHQYFYFYFWNMHYVDDHPIC